MSPITNSPLIETWFPKHTLEDYAHNKTNVRIYLIWYTIYPASEWVNCGKENDKKVEMKNTVSEINFWTRARPIWRASKRRFITATIYDKIEWSEISHNKLTPQLSRVRSYWYLCSNSVACHWNLVWRVKVYNNSTVKCLKDFHLLKY